MSQRTGSSALFLTWLFFLFFIFCSPLTSAEGGNKRKTKSFARTSVNLAGTKFNINNISTDFYNDGESDYSIRYGSDGLIYPKGSGKGAVFASGFLWAGKINGEIRSGGAGYRSGLVPGRVLPEGVPADQSDPSARIYRVRPDYKTADLSSEVNDGEGTADQVRAQYEKDWNDWPAKYGAPYEDINKDGKYEPSVDIPGVPGAGQTIWFAANDFDPAKTTLLYGSQPMGFEVQVTVWGYKAPSPFGDVLFRKYKLINKGNNDVTDMYIGMFSDVDDGGPEDDVCGCDSALQLGYIYNFTETDWVYGQFTPAVGFTLMQGPAVEGAPSDSALVNGIYIKGKKNLPMTSYYRVIKATIGYDDAPQGRYEGTLTTYAYLKGLNYDKREKPVSVPSRFGGGTTRFPVSGDPVTGSGWLDGYVYPDGIGFHPGDRRMYVSTGSFNMMPGDTQEVVFAEIVAGDQNVYHHLAGVSLLKAHAQFYKNYYPDFRNNLQNQPVVPSSGTGLHREVVLNWGGSYDSLTKIENYKTAGFEFEGYNIYQLPSPSSELSEGKLIAVYDRINGVKSIESDFVEPVSGNVLRGVNFNGGDTGLKYTLDLSRDSLTGDWLNDGTKYYFAVTAYFYNPEPGLIPNTYESAYNTITVIPQSADPGVRYEGKIGQTLEAVHVSGIAENKINAVVTDPALLTGHTYRIEFDSVSSNIVWSLTDETSGEKRINLAGLNDSLIVVDGIQYSLRRVNPGFGTGYYSGGIVEIRYDGSLLLPVQYDYLGEGYGGNSVWHSLNSNSSYYLSAADSAGKTAGLVPYPELLRNRDFEIKFTSGTNYAVKGFTSDSIITVPFEIWDLGSGTPDDNNDDRRMIPFIRENRPGFNSIQFSGYTDFFLGYPASDWIYFADPQGKDGYNKFAAECQKFGGAGGMYRPNSDGSQNGYWADLHGGLKFPISKLIFCDYNAGGKWPPPGTVIRFYTNKTYTSKDVFEIKSPGITTDETLAKEDVKAINVFPNPYYAYNPNETGKYDKFVTFNHLPQRAIIRIFNLAGGMVKRIDKNDPSQFIRWNLLNEGNYPVGSGLYIAYIEMPDLGTTKILKLSVIQTEIIPDHF